ncbi:MAG TPA: hypothetical protein VIL74_07500 [Pyrinomonadaceae bacterium]|jgi:hypothetical protein
MNNNSTAVEILEFKDKTRFTVRVNLSYVTGNTGMTRDEKRDFVLESVRNEMRTIAEQVEDFGFDLTMDNAEGEKVGPLLDLLGKLLAGLTESWELTEMQFGREEKQPETNVDVLDSGVIQ